MHFSTINAMTEPKKKRRFPIILEELSEENYVSRAEHGNIRNINFVVKLSCQHGQTVFGDLSNTVSIFKRNWYFGNVYKYEVLLYFVYIKQQTTDVSNVPSWEIGL